MTYTYSNVERCFSQLLEIYVRFSVTVN